MPSTPQNVAHEVVDGKLVITIDLNAPGTPSASGKTIVVASTRGNMPVEGTEVILGLNCYKYPPEE